MTSKKYIAVTLSALYLFIVINLALWHSTVKTAFMRGDLSRMAVIATPKSLTEAKHYTQHHTELADYIASGKRESFDVLTLGDSFSSGEYQDYLVNQYGLKIMNARVRESCLNEMYTLLDYGIIDEIKPRVIIIEIVERGVQGQLGRSEFVRKNLPEVPREKMAAPKPANIGKSISSGILPPVMVLGNFRFVRSKIRYRLHPNRSSGGAYITKLDRELFSNPGYEDVLFHFYEDLNYLQETLNPEMLNQNLNTAARVLKAKGIKLIFFAAADKYDLYYPYILDKQGRPENTLFQKLRELQDKEYTYIDTMKILRQELDRGEKDIYWQDDTHWSSKGIKIFCDELVKYILPEIKH